MLWYYKKEKGKFDVYWVSLLMDWRYVFFGIYGKANTERRYDRTWHFFAFQFGRIPEYHKYGVVVEIYGKRKTFLFKRKRKYGI